MSDPDSLPPAMPAPAGLAPIRIGEHPAADFANTLAAPGAALLDFIATPAALLDWLAGTPELADAHALACTAAARGELPAALAAVQALRAEWRAALPGLADAGVNAHGAAALHARLNERLAAGPWRWQLVGEGVDAALRAVPDYAGPDSVAAAIAVVLAQLLAERPAALLRKCENPACVLWFRDTSKRGNRRWCSMSACGNRAKAAAHRARLRAADD